MRIRLRTGVPTLGGQFDLWSVVCDSISRLAILLSAACNYVVGRAAVCCFGSESTTADLSIVCRRVKPQLKQEI